MAYRLIIVTIPAGNRDHNIDTLLKRYDVLSMWYADSTDGQMILNILIRREKKPKLYSIYSRSIALL